MARVPLEFRVEPASAGDESVAKREADEATATSRVLRVARKQLGVSISASDEPKDCHLGINGASPDHFRRSGHPSLGTPKTPKETSSEPKIRCHRRTRSIGSLPAKPDISPADFEIGELLGRGSYAKVVAARYRKTGKMFAIKIMDKAHIVRENKTRAAQIERTVLALLQHPNIVKLHCSFMDSSKLYLVLDLAPTDLRKLLQSYGTFAVDSAKFFAAEMILAVEYMHAKLIIHRDIKPDNWLLTATGHLLLADFGSAKIMHPSTTGLPGQASSAELRAHTADGETDAAIDDKTFCGTAEYVSPEMLNNVEVGCSSDLWAIACCVYCFFAGHAPFQATTEFRLFQKIVALDFTFPCPFPDLARDFTAEVLLIDPAQRLGASADGYISEDGYARIKAHAFFESIEWKSLPSTCAPPLRPYLENMPSPAASLASLASLDELNEVFENTLVIPSSPMFDAPLPGSGNATSAAHSRLGRIDDSDAHEPADASSSAGMGDSMKRMTRSHSSKELADAALSQSTWELNLGPLCLGQHGLSVKPQLMLGAKAWNVKTEFGLHDVRNGLKFNVKTEAFVEILAEGSSLRELHNSIACDRPGFSDALTKVAWILETSSRAGGIALGMIAERLRLSQRHLTRLLNGSSRRKMMLRVLISSGLGLDGELRLGWTDTKGYRMIGVGSGAQLGLNFGASIFAGNHFENTSIKIQISVSNFEFAYVVPTDEVQELQISDTARSETTTADISPVVTPYSLPDAPTANWQTPDAKLPPS